jgi:hypothetical protein
MASSHSEEEGESFLKRGGSGYRHVAHAYQLSGEGECEGEACKLDHYSTSRMRYATWNELS